MHQIMLQVGNRRLPVHTILDFQHQRFEIDRNRPCLGCMGMFSARFGASPVSQVYPLKQAQEPPTGGLETKVLKVVVLVTVL